jgi:RNA polymerase sigma-70 factor (ECF subfamily)
MPDPANHDFGAYRIRLRVVVTSRIPVDLRGRIDPSDIVQDTLCAAIRDPERYEGRTSTEMMGWLCGIARHKLIDRFHQLGREDMVEHLDGVLERTSLGISRLVAAIQPAPDARAIADEEAKILEAMLERLTPAEHEAIILMHCQDMPVAEIGRHMNRTPAAIGGLLKRGLRKLRELCDGRIEP